MSLLAIRTVGVHKLSGVLASLTYVAFTSITWPALPADCDATWIASGVGNRSAT